MTEHVVDSEMGSSRILTKEQATDLSLEIFNAVGGESWKEAALSDEKALRELIDNGIALIQGFEEATY